MFTEEKILVLTVPEKLREFLVYMETIQTPCFNSYYIQRELK